MKSLIAAGIALIISSAYAQPPAPIATDVNPDLDGHELLTKMLNHADQISYQGTFVLCTMDD